MIRPLIAILWAVFVVATVKTTIAQTEKTADFPDDDGFGGYILLERGEALFLTMRDQHKVTGEKRRQPQRFPLKGTISYPASKRLSIGLYPSEDGSMADKLRYLLPIAQDIDSLNCVGAFDAEAVKLLGNFTNLRYLACEASEDLEGEAAATVLSKLKQLECVGLSGGKDLVFGSTSFCLAMAQLKNLIYLSIPCEKLTHKDIALIASNPSLQHLSLRSRRPVVGAISVRELGKLTTLRELYFVCTSDVEVADFEPICSIRRLESLGIATDATGNFEQEIKARRPDIFFFIQPPSDEFE